jgi:manganese efflux pump family protein
VLALILVAASVGVSNLAAAIGLGAGGIDRGTRLRVACVFGLFEAGMPIVGLFIGHRLAGAVGREARWLAAAMLAAIGSYAILQAWRSARDAAAGQLVGLARAAAAGAPADLVQDEAAGPQPDQILDRPNRRRQKSIQLLVSGVALSLDNLVAGFALGAYQVSILTGAAVFGTVSVLMSLAGLEFGARIGSRSGQRGEVIGGVVLIGVGAAIGFGAIG